MAKQSFYLGCQKIVAFALFDRGKRPSEVYRKVKVKKRTLYRYFYEWRKRKASEAKEEKMFHLGEALGMIESDLKEIEKMGELDWLTDGYEMMRRYGFPMDGYSRKERLSAFKSFLRGRIRKLWNEIKATREGA